MNYLLDTCVLSELIRQKPDSNVVNWIHSINENNLWISALTFGELHKGILKMAQSERKIELQNWIEHDLLERFQFRIVNLDYEIVIQWGAMQCKAELAGKKMPAVDSLIAASALARNMTVATRNTADMVASGAALLNPWE